MAVDNPEFDDRPRKIAVDFVTSQKELPIYTTFQTKEFSYPIAGKEYTVREWADEDGREFNELFDGVLIAGRRLESVDELHPHTLAYVTEEASESKALEKAKKYIESDKDLLLLVFIRSDRVEDMVTNSAEEMAESIIESQ